MEWKKFDSSSDHMAHRMIVFKNKNSQIIWQNGDHVTSFIQSIHSSICICVYGGFSCMISTHKGKHWWMSHFFYLFAKKMVQCFIVFNIWHTFLWHPPSHTASALAPLCLSMLCRNTICNGSDDRNWSVQNVHKQFKFTAK